jgi:mannitol 2-dehydrogenase
VLSEPFLQWVLQDSFTAGRRPEDVGVQLVPDVEPYELMKLRLLNGTHQAMSYLGCLASDRLVHEVAQGPIVARFLMDFMTLEASPTPAPVPGIDLASYQGALLERFSNPGVRDTVARTAPSPPTRSPPSCCRWSASDWPPVAT